MPEPDIRPSLVSNESFPSMLAFLSYECLFIVQVRYDEELKVYLKLTGLRSSDVAKMKAKKSRAPPPRRPAAAPPPYSETPQAVVQQPVPQQQPPQYLHHQQLQQQQQRQQVPEAAASSAAGSSGMQQSLHQQQQQQQQLQATSLLVYTVDCILYAVTVSCVKKMLNFSGVTVI